MNRSTPAVLTLAALVAAGLALLPASANAQFRTRRDGDRPHTVVVRNDGDVLRFIARSERQSNAFRSWFERNYKKLRLGKDRDNRWLKGQIQDLDEAMERLRKRTVDGRPMSRYGNDREQMQDALNHARNIDREIFRERDTRFTYREWLDLRDTMNDLARLYDLRSV